MDQMNYQNKKVLVYGWARSGKAVYQLLKKIGANVYVTADEKPTDLFDDVNFVDDIDESFDLLVKNPGIRYEKEIIKKALNLNIPVITEVQVALDQFKGEVLAVTGSNGKTTTTTLIGKMLKADNVDVKVGGNIGIPVSELMLPDNQPRVLMLELSSFQLLGAQNIKPKIAVITNLFSSHIDFHHTRENYLRAKFSITQHQTKDDYLVLNDSSIDSKDFAKRSQANDYYFSPTNTSVNTYVNDGTIYFDDEKIIDLSKVVLVGEHNLENILAAITAAKIFGVSNRAIEKVLTSFKGLEHRLEAVGVIKERTVYNDSKATDIEATQKALASFKEPITLIAGGLDRGDDLNRLVPNFKNVVSLITYGQTKNKLQSAGEKADIKQTVVVDTLKEAVAKAKELSRPGQVLLFSPAAASWDQFPNFEIRGEEFKKMIKNQEGWS
ncbi:UDP-N-acetylmuramoyl-L-alanine--D-glutamate ligase [Oenococcus oeni]|uniref:UDP-N-acetylmuramoyl-L-alanine--D-glutamate ligase n=1 Tax=Oenococcus oeni TaxID=1247 RepID=UPI0010B800C3|nr:UDP-N-acetylmuramoyl-L-alanine--D-glutamate ligase [Oenococcus oeni]MDV7686321.1 UDP-N-acetylmuramoyl-L-alanine--D-glutamate ligase [Oenococcus oeni]SYW07132.1 UDP-N-acetylmuramoylalanyl-D-glutamate ligase [Oenococcus oeni]